MSVSLISFHKSARLPRLIVTDLDGTLLNPQHTISRRSIDALSYAQRHHSSLRPSLDSTFDTLDSSGHQSIQIMIASGRSPRSVQKVIDLFGGIMIPDSVLCCNGALSYNPKTRTISYPQFVPLDQALHMIQRLRTEITEHGTFQSRIPSKDHPESNKELQVNHNPENTLVAGRPGFACEVIWFQGLSSNGQDPIYAKDTSFVCDRTWESQRKHSIYYEYTVVDDTMEQFLQSLEGRGGIVKLLALDRNRTAPDVYESLPKSLRSKSAVTATTTMTTTATMAATKTTVTTGIRSEVALETQIGSTSSEPDVSLTYSGNYFLEISAAGVNKGLGLQRYCEANGIAREDVVAFGDLLNDAEMLQFAGLGLCMGNGHEEMKRLADRVIGTNAEDGLAKEIESWFTSRCPC
ncbi:hypothetical protein BGX28_003889 [Mortierella sp. GBA30]|nr:hypothetical protein BGX28_003889 [Mortierella sp. GBA30]